MRPITGSIIILYDKRKVEKTVLLSLLDRCLTVHIDHYGNIKGELCPKKTPAPSFKRRFLRVLAIAGVLVYSLIRKFIFKSPLNEGLISPLSILSTAVAIPFLHHAWKDMRQGKRTSIFPFMAAFFFFISVLMGKALAAIEIIWSLELSFLLEDYVVERSKIAIRDTFELSISKTREVRKGDTFTVYAGQRIVADGTVLKGEAVVDEAIIIGCSEFRMRKKGDRVFAGTFVTEGYLYILAEKVGDKTYICHLLHMIENAILTKAPVEEMAVRRSLRLMNLGSIAVIGTFLLTGDLLQAFTIMVVMSCTCATVLAASTAVAAALANAARNHILIKEGLYLELTAEANCFCFDKKVMEMPFFRETLKSLRKEGVTLITSDSYRAVTDMSKAVVILGEGSKSAFLGNAVRVAIGGTEAQAAHIVIADDVLRRVVFLRKLGQQTIRIINENYKMTIFTDTFGLVLEVTGLLSPFFGGILHAAHTFGVMFNSKRLIEWKPPENLNVQVTESEEYLSR